MSNHFPTKTFARCPILTYHELEESLQQTAREEFEDNFEDNSYVFFDGHLLNLSDFVKSESPIWDSYMGLSAWSGYFIKTGFVAGELEALVAYRHFS